MALDEEKRKLIDEGLASGKLPKEIAAEVGVSVTTVYNYKKQESDDPTGVAPPNIGTEGKKGKRLTKKPITEETAGQLCAGLFAIAAMLDGPEWFLTPEERQALASPFAESLRILPAPIAEGVNLYSAPVVFVTTLSSIMYSKGAKRAKRGQNPPLRAVPTRTVNPTSQGAAAAGTPPPSQAAPTPDANSPTPSNVQPTSVAAAVAAAKGGLTALDEVDDATTGFGS